jgi:anti-sigma factor RsiW
MRAMRCEEVQELLPEMAEGAIAVAGALERHVASCPSCAAELGQFRAIVLELGTLRDVVVDPPAGSLERVLDRTRRSIRLRLVQRVAADDRVRRAALSMAGAAVGATAIGLLWWRAAHRSVADGTINQAEQLAAAD